MKIRGERVIITPMKLKDVYSMRDWGKHDNPLFFDYNLPPLTREEVEEWYSYKVEKSNNRYYAVFNKGGSFIGYIGIKRIRKLWRDAVLGIVLDPNHIDQGYGTEILSNYLEYYFNEMDMKTMYLEVAKFNKRARRCYSKIGFYIVDEYLSLFFDQAIDRKNQYFKEETSSFEIAHGKIYNYIYKMRIDRKTYQDR